MGWAVGAGPPRGTLRLKIAIARALCVVGLTIPLGSCAPEPDQEAKGSSSTTARRSDGRNVGPVERTTVVPGSHPQGTSSADARQARGDDRATTTQVQPSNKQPSGAYGALEGREEIARTRALQWFTARPLYESSESRFGRPTYWAWTEEGGDSDRGDGAQLLEILYVPTGADPHTDSLWGILSKGGLVIRSAEFDTSGGAGWGPDSKARAVIVRGRQAFISDFPSSRGVTWTIALPNRRMLWQQVMTSEALSDGELVAVVERFSELS